MKNFIPIHQHLRYFLILLVSISFATNASAFTATPKYKLVLWEKNGLTTDFLLENGVTITFNDGKLVITNDVADILDYDLDGIWKWTYEDTGDHGSGIQSISSDYSVQFGGDMIVFRNLKAGSNISIYAVNGIQMMNETIANDGEYTFQLSNLTQGVYVVNVNGKTYKIVKK